MSFITIGCVGKPVGLKGDFLLNELQIDLDGLRSLTFLYLGPQNDPSDVVAIESLRSHGKRIVLKLKGINSRDDYERIRGLSVVVPETEYPYDLKENEPDMTGYEVIQGGNLIGVVSAIDYLPSHPVVRLRKTDGKHTLFPYVDEFVLRCDHDKRSLTVVLPEGFPDED